MNAFRGGPVAVAALLLATLAWAQDSFTRGHIFVTVLEADACDFGREAIVEIDPDTGESWVFADSDDGLCVSSGLRFSPDGKRLIVLNAGPLFAREERELGWVMAFHPDGTGEVLFDGLDGLRRPFGANGLAFDELENLYVVNTGFPPHVLKFPAAGGPPVVFADLDDGITGRGPLEFSPDGDLFYASDSLDIIIRITPRGDPFIFDEPPGSPSSLLFDRKTNLFVGSSGSILRYDHGLPDMRRVVATDFLTVSGQSMPIALSIEQDELYFAESGTTIYEIDANLGISTILVTPFELPLTNVVPTAITVFSPILLGDLDSDGRVTMKDFATMQRCWKLNLVNDATNCCVIADMDADGQVGANDYSIFLNTLTGP